MSKPKKANVFVKTMRTIDPALSTFAVFHPAGAVTTVFVVPEKVTVKIGAGGDAGVKSIKKRKNIVHSFIQFYLEYPLSLKSEIMSIKCQNMSFLKMLVQ